ncbi:hypothetical protein DL767_000106 [Monosporascus sp. MG133]|nr:hypothetical protein DL767_000106 [Monosporascus sp. MG133]
MMLDTVSSNNGHSFDRIIDAKFDMREEEGGFVSEQPTLPGGKDDTVYIQGPQFWFISKAIAIMMFIVNLEIPVAVAALVAITDDLGGFENVAWVVASYLRGYVIVIVICAKFSDIFGRQLVFLLSIAIFIIFSAACSASQTIIQLIIFRALQGMGGGECFSLCTILIMELVPPEKRTKYVSNLSVVNALALLLGSVVGGAIAANTTWRWIFIIKCVLGLARSAPLLLWRRILRFRGHSLTTANLIMERKG